MTRTPAWQQPLHDLSTSASTLLDTIKYNDWDDLEEGDMSVLNEMYKNILRLERILYEEKTNAI